MDFQDKGKQDNPTAEDDRAGGGIQSRAPAAFSIVLQPPFIAYNVALFFGPR